MWYLFVWGYYICMFQEVLAWSNVSILFIKWFFDMNFWNACFCLSIGSQGKHVMCLRYLNHHFCLLAIRVLKQGRLWWELRIDMFYRDVPCRIIYWLIKKNQCCCGVAWTWSHFTFVKTKKYTYRHSFMLLLRWECHSTFLFSLFLLQSNGCCGGCGCGWFFFIFQFLNGSFHFNFSNWGL